MPNQDFSLKPFPGTSSLPPVSITGALSRSGPTLAIRWELCGPLELVALPLPAVRPVRRHGLWEETCLELFFAPSHRQEYWELNLSTAGHWNIFRFESYRQGMIEEPAWSSLPCAVERRSQALRLTLKLDLSLIVAPDEALQVGVTAVIKFADGVVGYWALTHNALQPDFHRRDSFILRC